MIKFVAFMVGALAVTSGALAHDYHQGDITIDHPWARPTSPGAKMGVIYLSIKNDGSAPDQFVSIQTPAAEKAEMHESFEENGVMKMRSVANGVEVKPGAVVDFKPRSLHIMLMGLKQPLEEGQSFPATVTLEKAGPVVVEVKIEKTPSQDMAMPAGHDMDHHH